MTGSHKCQYLLSKTPDFSVGRKGLAKDCGFCEGKGIDINPRAPRPIVKMPTLHPFIEVTDYADIQGYTVFFYCGVEPEEDETKTTHVAGWRARVGGREYGDFVTLKDGLAEANVQEAYGILFDHAADTLKKIQP